jgi:predicted Zn-dependent peptidase
MAADPLAGALRYALAKEERVGESVTVHMESGQLASLFMITAILKPGAAPEVGRRAVDDVVDRLRSGHARFDRVQFALRREGLFMHEVYDLEGLAARADALNAYNHYAGTPDYAGQALLAMQDVEVEDVREALYQFLPFDSRVVAFVRPSEKAPRAGRLLAGGP